ncbi:MAG: hypothetical protein ACYSUC_01720 [Planctomycetota bacterium]|jgi:hypothetical protein
MTDKDKQIETVEMLAKHEEAIGQLYKAYSERYTDHRDFWLGLSDDESQHARWINELHSKVEDGSVHFKQDRFQIPAIRHSLNYVEKMLFKSIEADFELIEAFSTAWYIEDALLENKFFEVFETDSADLKETLRKLSEATAEHRQRIHDAKTRQQ